VIKLCLGSCDFTRLGSRIAMKTPIGFGIYLTCDSFDCRHELLGDLSLGHKRLGTDGNSLMSGDRGIILGKNHDLAIRELLEDVSRCLEAIHPGHRNVHEDNVGLKQSHLLSRLDSVRGFTTDTPVRAARQQGSNAFSDAFVVVNQQQTQ
jgi:hypothetical protein